MSAIGRARAGMFWRRNQFRFPGNGRMSGGVDGTRGETDKPRPERRSTEAAPRLGSPVGGYVTVQDGSLPPDLQKPHLCGDSNPPAQNLTGEFTELLHAPEYDQRATAVAQEEA